MWYNQRPLLLEHSLRPAKLLPLMASSTWRSAIDLLQTFQAEAPVC